MNGEVAHVDNAVTKRVTRSKEDIEYLESLRLDEYVEWMIDNNYYSIEPETGQVMNCRTGKVLKWIIDSEGYPYVELVYSRFLHRPIRIHRFIAIKTWGVAAVRGLHVAHLDRVKTHSVLSNLELKTPGDHNRYDGNHQHAKESWPECTKCGDPNGIIRKGRKTPARYKAEVFGLVGELCSTCYMRLYLARRKGSIA